MKQLKNHIYSFSHAFYGICLSTAPFLGISALGASPTQTALKKQPNFVIIMADDMGYGDASCYGGKIKTPHLDRMAREGMRFTDFHSSGNVCSPTRAGLLTGRYQQRAGIPGVITADPAKGAHHYGLQPKKEITFSKLLKQAGYSTAITGKWHLGYSKKFNPVQHGFDHFNGFVSGNVDYHSHFDRMEVFDWWNGLELSKEQGYSTHLITEHAIDFIENSKDQPFCVYVAHEAVHAPWQGPKDPPQRGPNSKPGIKFHDRHRAFREMLIEMDKGVGKILDKLVELELAENTFVFFLSDNGPAGGSAGGLRGRKGSNWEGGHRVPGIAWWPGQISAGKTSDQLAISLDLMPTMISMAGVATPKRHHFDGVDLTPLLLEGKSLGDRTIFWQGPNEHSMMAMRDGTWKLMKGTNDFIGLYDLSKDISEKNNLATAYPERVKQMTQSLKAWHENVTKNATAQSNQAAIVPQ